MSLRAEGEAISVYRSRKQSHLEIASPSARNDMSEGARNDMKGITRDLLLGGDFLQLFLVVFEQFVIHGVFQGLPAGVNDVVGHTHGDPSGLGVAGLNEHSDVRGRTGFAVLDRA
jgi:hypothetical protein